MMGQRDATLLEVARVAEWHIGDFTAESLSKIALAFVTAGQSKAGLFAVLARTVERCLVDFDVQDLSDIVWIFARVEQSNALQLTALE